MAQTHRITSPPPILYVLHRDEHRYVGQDVEQEQVELLTPIHLQSVDKVVHQRGQTGEREDGDEGKRQLGEKKTGVRCSLYLGGSKCSTGADTNDTGSCRWRLFYLISGKNCYKLELPWSNARHPSFKNSLFPLESFAAVQEESQCEIKFNST